MTSGGAIPETAEYRVVTEGERTFVGTLNEDFAIESNAGDVFQLGNASWQILQVTRGDGRPGRLAAHQPAGSDALTPRSTGSPAR